MRFSLASLLACVVVASTFVAINVVPLRWSLYCPVRVVPLVSPPDYVSPFEEAWRRGEVRCWGFPFVWKSAHDAADDREADIAEGAVIFNGMIGLALVLVTLALSRRRLGARTCTVGGQPVSSGAGAARLLLIVVVPAALAGCAWLRRGPPDDIPDPVEPAPTCVPEPLAKAGDKVCECHKKKKEPRKVEKTRVGW